MNKRLESAKAQLLLCILFSVLAITWVIVSNPMFPVSSLYAIELPYRFPILGFIVPFWLLYKRFNKMSIIWLLSVVPLLFGFNLHMLRPDVYLLWLFLLLVSVSKNNVQIYNGLLIILGAMYIWTAVQKMHMDFVVNMARVIDKRILSESLPENTSTILVISIPIFEMALGILCFTRFVICRKILAILVHLGILYFIIRGGWNGTMIPWNISLLVMHVLLPHINYSKGEFKNATWFFAPVLAFVFPAFHFLGYWPGFASWNMYSGKAPVYNRLAIDEKIALHPPAYIRPYIYSKDGIYSVSVIEWADTETGGAPCMEPIFANRVLVDCQRYIERRQ